jgi:ferrochelatase
MNSGEAKHMDRRIGVLISNLGTPAAPTPAAVRRYLAEFLADPRVVDLPRVVWLPILYLAILPFRAPRAARAYASIWTASGSPLLVNAEAQAAALRDALAARARVPTGVALGMRYGEPPIETALAALRDAGATELVVLPLYPQYSRTTTASTHDAVDAALARLGWAPPVRRIERYGVEPGYIAALAATVREHWQARGRGARLLMSFHGLPERYIAAGDPYKQECEATARALAAALGLADGAWTWSYQSRVGGAPWLRPYTDALLRDWAALGVGDIDVICPGFSADCLETLEEIAMVNAEACARSGARLRYVPALNARADHVAFLAELALKNIHF